MKEKVKAARSVETLAHLICMFHFRILAKVVRIFQILRVQFRSTDSRQATGVTTTSRRRGAGAKTNRQPRNPRAASRVRPPQPTSHMPQVPSTKKRKIHATTTHHDPYKVWLSICAAHPDLPYTAKRYLIKILRTFFLTVTVRRDVIPDASEPRSIRPRSPC